MTRSCFRKHLLRVAVWLLVVVQPACALAADPGEDFLRGMTVTCPRAGQIWGTPDMVEAVRELRSAGVRWIAIHPYARIERDGSIRYRPAQEADYLSRAVEIVRQEGLELFLKPHLAYWGEFAWRGEITFEDDASWQRFFSGYREFILDQARFAQRHGIPLLAVGVELEKTTHHEATWRDLVRQIRQVYRGRLTYAANWDRVEAVPFWDALDLVGVQAYFPLSDEEDPSAAVLNEGWSRHLRQLEILSRRLGGKKVLFTEIGYNRAIKAAREPWDYGVDTTSHALELRRRLLTAALVRLEKEPILAGVFWWKWMPGPWVGRSNFSMRDPEALEALRQHWAAPSPKAPAALSGEAATSRPPSKPAPGR